VLIYTASLSTQPSFELNIHNQCLDVDLVSPAYVTDSKLECCRPPDYKVFVGDTMRSGFIIKSGHESFGALIYSLQRKQPHGSTEISKNVSSVTQLLVVWRISEFKGLRIDVLLVEHDKGFEWDKDDLEKLRLENIVWSWLFTGPATKTWLLDGSVTLMITSQIMNEGCILDITISEVERENCTEVLLYVEPKR
jgi:hypothetical protein